MSLHPNVPLRESSSLLEKQNKKRSAYNEVAVMTRHESHQLLRNVLFHTDVVEVGLPTKAIVIKM